MRREMNKRGWIRIVEASISVIMILTVTFFLYTRTSVANSPDLSEDARTILEEIALDPSLRSAVISGDNESVSQAVSERISDSTTEYEIRICEVDDACGKTSYTPGNVYAAERVISASLSQPTFSPKKVRLFIWRSQ